MKFNTDPEWLKRMADLEDGCDVSVGGSMFEPIKAHYVSASCGGEHCSICKQDATHKISEEITSDDPNPYRHPFSAYLCCRCFRLVMGPATKCGE